MGTPLLEFVEKSGSVLLSLSLSLASSAFLVALNNSLQKRDCFCVFNSPSKGVHKRFVVDGVKEFSHVALQRIAGAGIVIAYCTKHFRDSLNAFVRAFADTTRKRIVYESRLKYFIKHRKSRVMENSVADDSLVNPPHFRVVNPEPLVWPVPVRFAFQIPIQVKNILLKIFLELQNVSLISFIGLKNLPCFEQSLWRNYRPI
jgi:hypothetical protein